MSRRTPLRPLTPRTGRRPPRRASSRPPTSSVRFPVGPHRLLGPADKWVARRRRRLASTVHHGETLGLVGESGSGKTTVGRTMLRRIDPSAGRIIFRGEDITHTSGRGAATAAPAHAARVPGPLRVASTRACRSSQLVAEPLVVHGLAKSAEAARPRSSRLLERCGLPDDTADRHPHAFSGGQRQRIGIARALALQPDFIVADEPVSALDVSVRAQVVNLLQDLQREFGIDLPVHRPRPVASCATSRTASRSSTPASSSSSADSHAVYETPRHPYTEALLSSVPIPDPPLQRARRRIVLQGEIPNPIDPPPGAASRPAARSSRTCAAVETPAVRGEGARPLGRLLLPLTRPPADRREDHREHHRADPGLDAAERPRRSARTDRHRRRVRRLPGRPVRRRWRHPDRPRAGSSPSHMEPTARSRHVPGGGGTRSLCRRS